MFYPRILYEIFKSRIVALLFRIQNWGWFPGFQVGHWDPSFLCWCFRAASCSPSSHGCLFPPWGSPFLSLLKPVWISFCSLLSLPFFFPLLLPFLPTLSSSHLPTSPSLVHSPALPYKRHFLDCSVITCPVYAVVFLFLSYPPLEAHNHLMVCFWNIAS